MCGSQFIVEEKPAGIEFIDQAFFLYAPPAFDFLFAGNGFVNVPVLFVVKQENTIVAARERVWLVDGVFGQPPRQIVGHARVQYRLVDIGEDVHKVFVLAHGAAACVKKYL